MPKTAWWHLYHVTFSTFHEGGRKATYPVITDQGAFKAVVIATLAHRARQSWSPFEVDVIDNGVIVGGPGGTAEVPSEVWDDRKEW
jgi:hypothetical protein